MTVPAEYALLVDASKWQTAVNYLLWRIGGVECLIGKISQGSYSQDPQRVPHYLGAKNTGMHYGCYVWADPMSGDKATVDNFFKALGVIEPEFICVDIEQYWQDWKEYQNGHVTKIISPQRISDNGQYICERLKERTGKEILVYTRSWFVVEWANPMYAWMDNFKKWFAQYTTDRADLHLSWETLKKSWLPKTKNPSFSKYYKGAKDWEIWQWTGDKFILPGCLSPMDVNYVKRSFLGMPLPEPEPLPLPQEVVVNTSVLNIRDNPNGNIIGQTQYGKILQVQGSQNDASGNVWYEFKAYVASWLTKEK